MVSLTGYVTSHSANEVLATHRHAEGYVALVVDGSYLQASADGPVACEPGALLVHPPWHAHGNRFGRHGARVVNATLGAAEAPGELRLLRIDNVKEAQDLLTRAPHRLQDLLHSGQAMPCSEPPSWHNAFVRELAHGDSDLAGLARRAGVSPAHAARSVARFYGMPPQLLRREWRLRRAISLLEQGHPLAEIAATSGFSDQAHMCRTVRAATGMSPGQLRQQLKCIQDARSTAGA